MSDNWITIIPEDPRFVPETTRQARAREWFRQIAPRADEIETKVTEHVEFFVCAEGFERVSCPSCRRELDFDWWKERMDEDYRKGEGFVLQEYKTPCCGTSPTLHELVYEWPAGFGRFSLEARNPNVDKLSEAQQHEVEEILATPVRIIYIHI